MTYERSTKVFKPCIAAPRSIASIDQRWCGQEEKEEQYNDNGVMVIKKNELLG